MSIERMAQAMLAAEHREVGYSGDIEPLWNELSKTDRARLCLYARAALGALQGEGMEEAVEAARSDAGVQQIREEQTTDMSSDDVAGVGVLMMLPSTLDRYERTFLEAAAPLLRAPLVAEVERLRGEKTTRERLYREQWERGNTAERERDAARGALAKWGWTPETCPEGQVGCYLPPGHTHIAGGPVSTGGGNG